MHIETTTTISVKADDGIELLRYVGKARSVHWDGTEEITETTKANFIKRASIALGLSRNRALTGIEGFVRSLGS